MRLPAHTYLEEQGIPYDALTFPETTEKGAANAHTGEAVLVMVGGDSSAISGHLKKAIGSRNVRMAALEKVKETTGYQVGSVPPFHWQPEGFRSFLDARLMEEEVLGVGAGVWGHEIMITPENLVKASRATVVNLTEKEKPLVPDNSGTL
jgi:Cys-tRNA(Pro)/Cys-tRNA(Cys) deacylase